MKDLSWRRPFVECGESSHCPEVARMADAEQVWVRSSERPGEITKFTELEWITLTQTVQDGEWDLDKL